MKLGAILFAIGLFIISPLDEIFILLPLSIIFPWAIALIPIILGIGILCLLVGAWRLGRNVIPLLRNPTVIVLIIATAIITLIIMDVI